jgi:hypothetical protein
MIKRPQSTGNRRRKPKSSQSVVTQVSPYAIERFARAMTAFIAILDHPRDSRHGTGRDMGGEYIAAIAEQRPGINGHGYPGGHPDWDQYNRLFLNPLDPFAERSLLLPDWMALPLLRRIILSGQADKLDKPDKPDE